jgi:Zn-dependent peptidase ImmA (M78 family)/DNA-binding XRE family transcriptional regulator
MSFGERLKAARAMAGLSQDELVGRIGGLVTKQAISKYEKDLMKPESSTTVIALAGALHMPVDYFFRSVPQKPMKLNFRKRAGMGSKAVSAITETVRDRLERYSELEDLLGISPSFKNPFGRMELKGEEGALMAAKRLREAWGIGADQPIADITQLLEDNGVKVIEAGEFEDFDGMTGYYSGRPFVAIQENLSKDRIRFTLLHELAHILLCGSTHQGRKQDEKLCNLFASEFLLPAHVLRLELPDKVRHTIAIPELLQIKSKYGISMQAILFRAHALTLLSDAGYSALMREFGRRGWRKKEPGGCPGTERPARFKRLLYRAVSEDVISLSKAAALSLLPISDIEAELSGEYADRNK